MLRFTPRASALSSSFCVAVSPLRTKKIPTIERKTPIPAIIIGRRTDLSIRTELPENAATPRAAVARMEPQ